MNCNTYDCIHLIVLELNLSETIDGYPGLEHSIGIVPLGSDVTKFMAWSNRTYTPTLLVNYGGPWGENYFYTKENPYGDPKLQRFTAYEELALKSRRRMASMPGGGTAGGSTRGGGTIPAASAAAPHPGGAPAGADQRGPPRPPSSGAGRSPAFTIARTP